MQCDSKAGHVFNKNRCALAGSCFLSDMPVCCIRPLVTGRLGILQGMKPVFLPPLCAHHSAERRNLEQGAGGMHRVSGCVTKHVTCPDNYQGYREVCQRNISAVGCIFRACSLVLGTCWLKHATRPLRGSRFFFSSASMRVY